MSESAGVLIPPFLLVALGCILVYAQNDFSTAAIAGLAAIAMFWVAGAPLSFFLGLGAAATPLAFLSILTSDFRLRRILAFLFPEYEPHGQGYQILGSIKAVRSGGLFGVGFGLGSLKRGSIPEVQSDFIFAAWAEETGFLGVLAVLGAFAFLAWRAFRVAFAETEGYRSYLGMGMAFLLCLEILVNVAVVAGALPATGMALPFFSAGGSSLLSTAISCGLLYNLSGSSSLARSDLPSADRRSPRRGPSMSDYAARAHVSRDRRASGGLERVLSIVLAAVLAMAALAAALFLIPPALRVTRYEISGNSSMTRDEVLSAALIHGTEYFFSIDASRVKAALSAEPRVASASVSKLFPNGLLIVVREEGGGGRRPRRDRRQVLGREHRRGGRGLRRGIAHRGFRRARALGPPLRGLPPRDPPPSRPLRPPLFSGADTGGRAGPPRGHLRDQDSRARGGGPRPRS